jgi:hypothetical protein
MNHSKGVSTWSHHLVDAVKAKRVLWMNLKGRPVLAARHQELGKIQLEMASAFEEASVFVMQHDGPDLMDDALVDHARNTWQGLPYPEMLLEFPMPYYEGSDGDERWIVWASEIEGHVQLSLFMAGTNTDRWMIELGFIQFRIGGPGNLLSYYIDESDHPDYKDLNSSRLQAALFALLSLIGLLNTPAVEKEVHEAPEKLNRARTKRGKVAVPTYTAITLRLPKHRYRCGADGSSERASPRAHWRSGHLRTYPSGKRIPIAPTLVAWTGEDEPPAPKYNVIIR